MGSTGESNPPPADSLQWLGKPRPVRVIVVGAGISGIAAVKLFNEMLGYQPVSLTIYEKNDDVGGTWLENRYSGCSCDIPAHGYTYSWEGNPDWSRLYIGAEEIFDFYKGRAEAYGVFKRLKLLHRVVQAIWSEERGKWELEIEDLANDRTFTNKAKVLINAGGYLKFIPGLDSYEGTLIVVVIGSGSSVIQIVPRLQKVTKYLFSFVRSPIWITPEFGGEFAASEGRNTMFTTEQRITWRNDSAKFLQLCKALELGSITPGHGYLEALVEDNVTVIGGGIRRLIIKGLKINDGKLFKVNVIICVTSFNIIYRPSFKELRSYISVAASGFPNYFIVMGLNFPLINGTIVLCMESTLKYVFKVVRLIQTEGVKSMSSKEMAVEDFQVYKDRLMKEFVWISSCRSWYKNRLANGKVWGPWLRSAVHFIELLERPRWEDYKIKYLAGNWFDFLEKGVSRREANGGDLAWFV
ncbi:hypothetical protein BKA64DRAFT_696700 [Cadophora sp. MPI-SDFR-AT-0126]|nr:hypothetical protein BKA64DRAFT_696700 [Leotiomycetes sp. MPI-SDFR-AT-0126]